MPKSAFSLTLLTTLSMRNSMPGRSLGEMRHQLARSPPNLTETSVLKEATFALPFTLQRPCCHSLQYGPTLRIHSLNDTPHS
jgi:hypothetical protein